jgi:hypothetical protein
VFKLQLASPSKILSLHCVYKQQIMYSYYHAAEHLPMK